MKCRQTMKTTAACQCRQIQLSAFLLLLVLALTTLDHVDGFGFLSGVPAKVFRQMAHSSLSEIAEAVDGDIYLDAFLDNSDGTGQALGATDKLLSKRVPVAIRYSADSGMKPYFLTVAKKLKESHPDIILDKVILPKVVIGDGKTEASRPTFEVMVDGKVVVPTPGKKDRDRDGILGNTFFVSMQELDVAISRARRRRRPSTVYGEDESNVRLEILKAKAAALSASNSPERNSHKHSSD